MSIIGIIYWFVAACYGFAAEVFHDEDADRMTGILAERYHMEPAKLRTILVIVSAAVWPLTLPGDLFWIGKKHFSKK